MIELNLPYPPSTNNLWTRTRKGMRKTNGYVAWLMLAGIAARQQKFESVEGVYKLSIQAVRPDKRKRDLDNIIKPISDLLQSLGIVRDDCDCEMLTARWVTVGEGVQVRVERAGVEI